MNALSILLALTLPFSMTACSTTSRQFIAPASTLATAAVLAKGVSDEDRADKARMAYEVANGLELLTTEGTTGKEVTAAVIAKTGKKAHWVVLAAGLGSLYNQFAEKLGQSQSGMIIKELAIGIKAGAEPYLAVIEVEVPL